MTQSLRKICDEALKGPWYLAEHSWQETSVYSVSGTVCKLSLSEKDVTEDNQDEKEAEQLKTAKFIATARTALPAALDLIEKLAMVLKTITIAVAEEVGNCNYDYMRLKRAEELSREALAAVKEFEGMGLEDKG